MFLRYTKFMGNKQMGGVITRGLLHPGNIVKARAEGPDMVVEKVYKSTADCVWIEQNSVLRAGFPVKILRLSNGPAMSKTIHPTK